MLIDERTTFAWETTIPTATGAAKFGEVIDLTAEDTNQGEGYPLYLVILITTAMTSSGSATIKFELVTDEADDLDTEDVVLLETPQADFDDFAVGDFVIVVPIPKADYKQYLGVRSVVGTAALTAGAATAFITRDPPAWRAYPEGNN